ncbi:MAG TPA: NAD(P)/FAD-dependent oxidoreductase [Segeticoccus sp.]|uniref:dihydrolipoyl dehydrogenase family protein n=1 Tax=Segeticoccus sp. TaxID=2706531 RepID=UPI002D7F7274|nr:NAD(P)/FAD-dependent oxidoreductase [Segeticoccus sp.]HET8600335.1 NAD(P)/FAD-dependent oxidoreductase [Segeticoccus sp.]
MESASAADSFDVIVIGAGPVGENAADRAGRDGLRVAIVERRLVGGECSYYACTPSKALLRPVLAQHAAERVEGVTGARLAPSAVLHRRDTWISHLDDSGQVSWLDDAGITLLRGHARLVGERAVEVDGHRHEARVAVVLATGSDPALPDIPGLRDAQPWTNRQATTAEVIPERLVVLGGGVVACELATAYAALGSRVTLLQRGPRLLGRAEDVAGELVADGLRAAGVDVRLGVQATTVQRPRPGGEVTVQCDDGETVTGDELLAALGRRPATADLGVDTVGATMDDSGYVVVDDTLQVTSVAGGWLYACGDVTGRNLLTHMGKYDARVCGDVIAARAAGRPDDGPGMRAWADHLGPPQVVFTDPEVASVGLTSSAARERGLRVRTVDVDMSSAAGASLQADGYTGCARMVVDEDRGVLVGVTFVGQDVQEMAHAATIAVVGEVPLDRLWHAVPSFPTMSEVWLRLLEQAGC